MIIQDHKDFDVDFDVEFDVDVSAGGCVDMSLDEGIRREVCFS